MAGKLSVVATPIGNLEDVTLRALRVLGEADIIAAEDTRTSKKLLSHFHLHTPLTSFHAHSGAKGFAKVLALLQEGKHVALVCDAGTPGVSDPGLELVSLARELLGAAIPIETIQGASSLTAARCLAGLRAQTFTFYGFLPLKKGREKLLAGIAADGRASVFFESPHRIMKALQSLAEKVPDRRVGIFRELTKLHEEAIVAPASELVERFGEAPERHRGEFVVIVEAN